MYELEMSDLPWLDTEVFLNKVRKIGMLEWVCH